MEEVNRSGHLEDNRFKEVASVRKQDAPHQVQWLFKDDYFSEELFGFYASEVENLKKVTSEAFDIFCAATTKILSSKNLHLLGIPRFFEKAIYHSWEKQDHYPFFLGRFDINGGIGNSPAKVIEFNADTYTTVPETIHWQALQLNKLQGNFRSFNNLGSNIGEQLKTISGILRNPNPVILASSLGYKEDQLNATAILDVARAVGYKPFYQDLEKVVFSEEGIFYMEGDEYVRADVWYKVIPWDWMFNEEPELAKIMTDIILNDLAIVLNPPFTTIWQNKAFLAYITEHFPNSVIAETYSTERASVNAYVKKPVYGRIGENIFLKDDTGKEFKTKGDYGHQKTVFQKYYPLIKDDENYYYQVGMFYGNEPCAINLRIEGRKILTDDCDFMSHFILP